MTIQQELAKSNSSPYIEMFEIDGRMFHPSIFFHFTPHSDTQFTWGGYTWDPFPIQIRDVKQTTEQPARPKLTISNATKLVQPYLQQYDGLVSCIVRRRRTLAIYLPDGAEPDNTQEMPRQEYRVSASMQSDDTIEFELCSPLDMPNVLIPRCQIVQDNVGGNTMWVPAISTVRFRGN